MRRVCVYGGALQRPNPRCSSSAPGSVSIASGPVSGSRFSKIVEGSVLPIPASNVVDLGSDSRGRDSFIEALCTGSTSMLPRG
jgi:hypothetical protein